MKSEKPSLGVRFAQLLVKLGIKMRAKLVIVFLFMNAIPIILLGFFAFFQVSSGGLLMQNIAVEDATQALNDSAVENIERLTTDTAQQVADFLYARDADLLSLAALAPTQENYAAFSQKTGRIVDTGQWQLNEAQNVWQRVDAPAPPDEACVNSNEENNEQDAFRHRHKETFSYLDVPLYDEITFIDLNGQELIKITTDSPKVNYPMNPALQDVSKRENTYIKAEDYFEKLGTLAVGEIYVSDVIGAYTKANYIGLYTPQNVAKASSDRGYEIEYNPEEQAYAGQENPNGKRFEGIIRFATPVANAQGEIIGYVTFALNHDHIMEFVDHKTPMTSRYTDMPSAYEGNYAFIWDYKCRSICHPRHNSIVGYDPETGRPEVPWLESSIYEAWQKSGVLNWQDFVTREKVPLFYKQSREKTPAPALTQAGYVGLDGRYLNNAPQCTGWMDLTEQGGSGSFYILWSGLHKLTTAAAIPYYTGQYAPSEENNFSYRGFGIVTIGAGLDDFTQPAADMNTRMTTALRETNDALSGKMMTMTVLFIVMAILVAFFLANWLTGSLVELIEGVSRFRGGERRFRFRAQIKDEFGTLADSFDDMAQSIEDSVKHPLSIVDMNQKIIYMNQAGLRFVNKTEEEIIDSFYEENSIYPPNSKYNPITALLLGREAEVYHDPVSGRFLKGTASYFYDKSGTCIGYIIESIDMTELSQAKIDLEDAKKLAEEASAHKGDFLARMSHEIRTPMNAIIGITNILQKRLNVQEEKNEKTEQMIGYVNQIESSSQHLLSLLNDVLDVSKIEAGKIELIEEIVDLETVVETVRGMIKARCDENQVQFVCQFDQFNQQGYLCDALRLRQVLINLLGNAIKFTPKHGTVTFSVQKLEQKQGKTRVAFSVKDTGVGISEESIETIFKPFEQANKRISQQYGGTGLGLSISKSIVEMMGGTIEIESTLGSGSEFRFAVWLSQAALPTKKAQQDMNLKQRFAAKRMLLVDDVDINRMIVSTLLEDTDFEIVQAQDGQQAVDLFTESLPHEFDIILMDVQMPRKNGHEATREIRALAREDAKTVPIIALTANAFKEDIDKALACGMNGYLSKPVEYDTLISALFNVLKEEGNEHEQ